MADEKVMTYYCKGCGKPFTATNATPQANDVARTARDEHERGCPQVKK